MITLEQYIAAWWHQLVSWLQGLWDRWFGQILDFDDSGISVRVGRPLAEGGFSVVLQAADRRNQGQEYALKRIRCQDDETIRGCQNEAKVHQTLQHGQPTNARYLMPLYGIAWTDDPTVSGANDPDRKLCYMLFPLLPHSLRREVNDRIFFFEPNSPNHPQQPGSGNTPPRPWNERVVLEIFEHLLRGVAILHQAGYSHRDIKLENILCKGPHHLTQPVLMDFGSAGPLSQSLDDRRSVLGVADTASQHTTVSYRPPELFAGELRVGDPDLDYARVDVWSLGCVLFAILYGASPFESEFDRRTGRLQVVDCTQLRVLGKVPRPPAGTPPAKWYSPEVASLLEWILTHDRTQRPTLAQVQSRVHYLLHPDGRPPSMMAATTTTTTAATTTQHRPAAPAAAVHDIEENFFATDFSNRSMTY